VSENIDEAAKRPVRAKRGPGEGASGEPGGSPGEEARAAEEAARERLRETEAGAGETLEEAEQLEETDPAEESEQPLDAE
jgi:hypothetical protein